MTQDPFLIFLRMSPETHHKLERLKPVFHFNRIVAKRSVFLCFLTIRVELMTSTQKKMLRYVTIRLKWKTGFRLCLSLVSIRSLAVVTCLSGSLE
jgi:hypothetical protein